MAKKIQRSQWMNILIPFSCSVIGLIVGLTYNIDHQQIYKFATETTQQPVTESPTDKSIPPYQKIASAIALDSPDNALEALKLAGFSSNEEIARQLLLFIAHSNDELQSQRAAILLSSIVQRMDAVEAIPVLLPLLSHSPEIRDLARDMIIQSTMANPANLEVIFRRTSDTDKQQLAKLLYEYIPSRAIPLMAAVYEQDDSARKFIVEKAMAYETSLPEVPLSGYSEATLAKANSLRPSLSDLVQDDRWWVRLYAATTMRKHRALRDRELVDLLLDDPNDVVRSAFSGVPQFSLYHRDPMPGREAGAAADRLNEERFKQLQEEGALDILEKQIEESESMLRPQVQ